MTFLRLFNQAILRDVARNPARTLLTLSGVALGIAVVVAVQLSNDRAIASFSDSMELLNGQADLRISANGRPLDETLMGELAWVWDVGAMTAILEGRVQRIVPGGEAVFGQATIRLFGVDMLSEAPFRTYSTSTDSGGRGDLGLDIDRERFIDLLTSPDALLVPRVLAEEWNASEGDSVNLLAGNREHELSVLAVLNPSGVAEAFDGRIVFMDIAAAQRVMRRTGEIDRIEVVLDDPAMADAVASRIADQLPASVVVDSPEDDAGDAERMTRAFRYNLTALSYIALVVGMILIYNTLNIAVVRRHGEIGALRTLGVSRRAIGWMFLAEALAFGVVGAVAGIWIGEFLARAAGALVSRTLAMLYTGMAGAGSGSGPAPGLYLEMILLGGALAAVSGAGPALRATGVSPIETIRSGMRPRASSRLRPLAGVAALALGAALGLAPAVDGLPVFGYTAGVAFIAGFGLLSPLIIRALTAVVRPVIVRARPVEGTLAVETIQGRLPRVAVAVISLSIAMAMLASMVIMVASFRDTVVVWVDQTLRGDLYVRPAASGRDGANDVAPETLAALDGVPGIEEIDRYRRVDIDYNGFPTTLGAGQFDVVAARAGLQFMDGRGTAEVARDLIGHDRVAVSEPFAVRHGLGRGDSVALPTPEGLRPFEIAGVFYDYSSDGGLVVMDRGTYLERFADEAVSTVAVYLEPGSDAEAVRREITARLDGVRARIATNGELREQILRVFDQTFEVTYALEVVALAVAVMGIANMLAALILERRRELAALRFIGASRRQIGRIVMIESGLVGVLGGVIGLLLGGVLSLLLVYVINFQSFGWTIQFTVPAGFLAQSLAMVLIATLAAGLYPAALALKLDPIEGIRAE